MSARIIAAKRNTIYLRIREIVEVARHNIARTVNFEMVRAYWLIGKEIVEEEQKGSLLFERLALSKDKKAVLRMARKGQEIKSYQDLIKDPYVLEFTGLQPQTKLYESNLEQALIDICRPNRS